MLKAIKYLLFILVLLGLTALALLVIASQEFGGKAGAAELKRYAQSSNYNSEERRFLNVNQSSMDASQKHFNTTAVIREFLRSKRKTPSVILPTEKPNFEKFLQPHASAKVIWLGHSTFLLNVDGKIILVDPVFGNASPLWFTSKRFQAPVISIDELPKIDFVLISHDHYDHLETSSIKHLAKTTANFVVPLGVGTHLREWGVNADQIIELDWWQKVEFGTVSFTATPSQHFSGRRGVYDYDTLWASWVIAGSNQRLFFSGDSGYAEHFKLIGEQLGPFDLALMENGQYNQLWPYTHLMPHEFIKAFTDLRAKQYLPIHWGVFSLAPHAWNEPIFELMRVVEDTDVPVIVPLMGQTITVGETENIERWWAIAD